MSRKASANGTSLLPVTVTKPIPLTFDLGNLTAFDANPLPEYDSSTREDVITATARDATQLLINQILSTIPLKSTSEAVYAQLPEPTTPLPREKHLPKAKEPTKWELFAKKKGIAPKAKDGKLIFDEAKKEWVPKWGYKGANKGVEDDWLVEVDEKQEDKDKNPRHLNRAERIDRIKKNERQQKKNERNAGRNKGGSDGAKQKFSGGKGVKKRKY